MREIDKSKNICARLHIHSKSYVLQTSVCLYLDVQTYIHICVHGCMDAWMHGCKFDSNFTHVLRPSCRHSFIVVLCLCKCLFVLYIIMKNIIFIFIYFKSLRVFKSCERTYNVDIARIIEQECVLM